jgi:BolA protein
VEYLSWRHAGHAGAEEGAHFSVTVVSAAFAGKSLVERHKMVYQALAGEMEELHALSIQARAPDEAA